MVSVGRATVEVDVELDRAAIAALGKKLEASLERLSARTGNKFSRQFDIAIGRLGVRLGTLTSLAPAAASAINVLGGAITALTANIYNTVSASFSLVGVLGALIQGFGVAQLAFNNFGKAIVASTPKQFENATKRMGDAAISTVKSIRALGDQWKSLRSVVQEATFKGVAAQIDALAKVGLPILRKELTQTGVVINSAFTGFAKLAQTNSFLDRFGALMSSNNTILQNFANASIPALDGLLNLMLALAPSAERLSASIGNLAARFQAATQKAGYFERVDAFMKRAAASAKLFWGVIGNLGGALAAIFRAATPAGDKFMKILLDVTQRFQDFANSAKGQSAIAAWADQGVKAMVAFGGLLKSLGGLFSTISNPAVFQALVDVFTSMSNGLKIVSPIFETIITALAKFASAISPILGPLLGIGAAFLAMTVTLSTVGSIIGGVVGPLLTLVGVVGGIIASFTTASATTVLWFVSLGKAASVFKAMGTVMKVVSVVFSGFSKVLSLVATGFRILTAALIANPFIALIVGIIAVGAALVLLYKKSETFRNIVNAAFAGISSVAIAVWEGIKTAAVAAFNFVSGVVTGFVGALVAIFNVIKTVFVAVFTFLTPVFNAWLAIFKAGFTVIKFLVQLVSTIIQIAFIGAFLAVKLVVTTVFDFIKAYVTAWLAVFTAIFQVVAAVATVVWNKIKAAAQAVFDFLSPYISAVIDAIGSVIQKLQATATAVFNKIKAVVLPIWNSILSVGRTVFATIGGVISAFVGAALTAFGKVKAFLGGIWDGLAAGAAKAFDAAKAIINSVIRGINKAIGPINRAAKAVGASTIDPIPELATGVRNFKGGVALVGERGPELVNLPKGSDVHTNRETQDLVGGNTFHVEYNEYGPRTNSARLREVDFLVRFGTRVAAGVVR